MIGSITVTSRTKVTSILAHDNGQLPKQTASDPNVTVNFSDSETPVGVVNGINTVFILSQAPAPKLSLILIERGLVLTQDDDYTLQDNMITFFQAPISGTGIKAWYRYQ